MSIRASLLFVLLLGPLMPSAPAQTPVTDVTILSALEVSAASLQSLNLPNDIASGLEIPLFLEGERVTISLSPYSLRGKNYQLLIDVGGGELIEAEAGPETTARGSLLEYPGSIVSASLSEEGFSAVIELPEGQGRWGVQPLRDLRPAAPSDLHLVYSVTDLIPGWGVCGTPTLDRRPAPPSSSGPAADGTPPPTKVCEIAFDADVEFFQLNASSVNKTEQDITKILNNVEAIYLMQPFIRYEITTIIVRTSEADPYSSTSPGGLLNQFDSHWSNSQSSVPRDIAHFMTGKDLDGGVIGVAYLSGICSFNNGYGLSQSRFTTNLTSRVGLTAHELGHNWDANHCDGQSDCGIMCSGLGGCTGNLTAFGASPLAEINNEKNNANCLSNGPPPEAPAITGLNPPELNLLSNFTLSILGDHFLGSTSITMGNDTYVAGQFEIKSDQKIVITPNPPANLGPIDITIEGPWEPSNTVTIDWAGVNPPYLNASSLAYTPLPHTWSYYGGAQHTGYLLIGFFPSTINFGGFKILTNPFILNVTALDHLGTGQFTVNLPVSTIGLLFYSQLATISGSNFIGASNIIATQVWL